MHRALRYALAGGTLAFGIAASFRTGSVAALLDQEEDEVRALGMRELRSGVALLTEGGRLGPLLTRLRYDAGAALGLLRRKPNLAPLPAGWAALALACILTRDRPPRE